jgi:type II secretory pathway pseudopilin PulG
MKPITPATTVGGFTLVELLVAMTITMVVLGGAVMLTSQVQNGYRRQVEDSAAVQEGRFALDWIGRLIRGAGNNPFSIVTGQCPSNPTVFAAIRLDPNGNSVDDDIRLQSDANPSDGRAGGTSGACNQSNEDVTIALDAANDVIVFTDNNIGGGSTVRTDKVIEDLRFIYRDSAHAITTVAAAVVFVTVQVTVRTRTIDATSGAPMTRILSSDIRVRSR